MKKLLLLLLLLPVFGKAQTIDAHAVNVSNKPQGIAIGDHYGGGIIAYILQPGDHGYSPKVPHGLIAAPYDQSTNTKWDNSSFKTTGATGTAIGTGRSNTTSIITSQGEGSYAAFICQNYTSGGYTD